MNAGDGPGSAVRGPVVERGRAGPWFMFRGPVGFEYLRVRLAVPGLPGALAGLRLLHLSDLHLRTYWSRAYDKLIRRLEADPPDLICFTGDFIDDKHDARPALPHLRRLLPALKSRLGTFGILGNHDPAISVPEIERTTGLHLIDGRRAVLEGEGGAVELIGLPGLARHDLDERFVAALPARRPGTLRVVLSHYPDLFGLVRPLAPDLFLAGHTHGGQICLPGGRPLLTHDSLPKRLSRGVHRLGETWFLVSRGMGFASVPVRLFCPAEVTEVVLQAG